jgi:hypothetical protein
MRVAGAYFIEAGDNHADLKAVMAMQGPEGFVASNAYWNLTTTT